MLMPMPGARMNGMLAKNPIRNVPMMMDTAVAVNKAPCGMPVAA